MVIIGLGNPGSTYQKTRHNVGHWFIDRLAKDLGVSLKEASCAKVFSSKAFIGDQPVWLVKTNCYMNVSGFPIFKFMKYYKLGLDQMAVVYDELDFPCGKVKHRLGGSAGGHNGIKDIIRHMGAQFHRFRIGIDHPGEASRVSSYVLGAPGQQDQQKINEAIDHLSFCLQEFLIDQAKGIQLLHSKH